MATTRRFVGLIIWETNNSRAIRPLRLIAAPPVGDMIDWYVTLDISHGEILAVFEVPPKTDAAAWRSAADEAALSHITRLLGGQGVSLRHEGAWQDINKPDW